MKMRRIVFLAAIATTLQLSAVVPAVAAQNRPILVITDYSTSPKEVEPGAAFTLTLTLKNEGRYRAKQLLLTLESGSSISGESAASSSGGGGLETVGAVGVGATKAASGGEAVPISVLGSGNVRFIGDIEAGETETVGYKLISSGDSKPRAYNLGFLLEYVNAASGGDESARRSLGLPLVRNAGLRLRSLRLPKKTEIGRSFKITAEIINGSSFTVNGVNASVADKGLEVIKEADFIGALDGGDSDSFEILVRPKRGAREVNLSIGYRDDYNQERKITRSLRIAPKSPEIARTKETAGQSTGVLGSIGRFFRALLGIGSGA